MIVHLNTRIPLISTSVISFTLLQYVLAFLSTSEDLSEITGKGYMAKKIPLAVRYEQGHLHPRCAPLVSSPCREHAHTKGKLCSAFFFYRPFSVCHPLPDSLSCQRISVPPPFHQLLPPADPNWSLGFRLRIINPVNTQALNLTPQS
jgi:hypothetical protein